MSITICPIRHGRRHGLATLEMALSLPILLFVMALMVNFGAVACWKVRALCVARHSVWGNRSPRTTALNPRPTNWPLDIGGPTGLAAATELDGPRVSLLDPGGFVVPPKTDVMNPTLELLQGNSHLSRKFPMLGKLGHYDLTAQTQLLDNKWEFERLGLSHNEDLRIPVVYTLPPAPKTESMALEYSKARQAILDILLNSKALWPLDREADFVTYGLIIQQVDPTYGIGTPDFHPRLQGFCSLDKSLVDELVRNLIDRIQGKKDPRVADVAETMTRAFIGLYQRAIQAYKNLISANPPPSNISDIQSQINQLQQKIDTLNQFLQTLP